MTPEESFKKYPYYIHPAIVGMETADSEERRTLLRRIAVAVGPESALRTLIGVDPAEFRDFYGSLDQPSPDTDETINEFLDRFDRSPHLQEAPDGPLPDGGVIPVAPPVMDYAAQMLADNPDIDDDMPDDPTASLLSSFLGSTSNTEKQDVAEYPADPDDNMDEEVISPEPQQPEPEPLSEALVKIMVKNGNYRKALEIITELNLKNPKKSVYFADQIRFLNKLIQTQKQ